MYTGKVNDILLYIQLYIEEGWNLVKILYKEKQRTLSDWKLIALKH